MSIIDTVLYGRAKVGYHHLGRLLEALGDCGVKFEFTYLFETNEILVSDKCILDKLKLLQIPYDYYPVENSIKYIKED